MASWAMLALGACTGDARQPAPVPPATQATAVPAPTGAAPALAGATENTNEETTMTGTGGAVSPAGGEHSGEIVHEDKIDSRTWTRAASEVPVTIAWVEVNRVWEAVVRIEITGTHEQRWITKFGKGGKMLETTIQQPRPSPGHRPAPTPTPTPKPTPGK